MPVIISGLFVATVLPLDCILKVGGCKKELWSVKGQIYSELHLT